MNRSADNAVRAPAPQGSCARCGAKKPWLLPAESVKFKLLAICFALLSGVGARGATNLISGNVTNDSSWAGTNLLQGTVVIRSTVVVTIDPGTRLLMSTGATLRVEGQLIANGSSNQPITFTRSTASTNWGRILFVRAADSPLRHCVIEYANSVGSHLDYYDDDCDASTPPRARNYHEAVVIVASHVDFDGCIFRNLPDNSGTGEGDAIAVISDDPQNPGPASANIRSCDFLAIGQGVHTRYSYVLVENCFFTGHHGDNDDVDLYGESAPAPLIRNNVFLNPAHDDTVNPTRCSAVIIGNVMSGGDDHGIVLRDKCSPVVINNLIYNFASGGIAVQNQCDAFIANNTILNCTRGIRFFDHTSRWGPPYCLVPGSGRATVINCILWDCATSFELADSPYTQDRGSHATVLYSDIEGGQATASVSANSTLTWGAGNINSDPQFVGLNTNNFHLRTNSPCLDVGTNLSAFSTNLSAAVTNDFDGIPRPLDGDGDGLARFDLGAYEYLLATADSNGDGIPDGWTWRHGMNPTAPGLAGDNPDGDPHTTFQEWMADTDPTDALSYFRIASVSNGTPLTLQFVSSANRQYGLFYSADLLGTNTEWTSVPGQADVPGTGGLQTLGDTNAAPARFYRVGVKIP